jgi:hypothetical protein
MPARNEASGQYSETYPIDAFIRALEHLDGDVGTKAVENAVGCEYRTAIAKLHELEEQGVISSRRIGNAYLWNLEEPDQTQALNESPQIREESVGDAEEETRSQSGVYHPTSEWE